MKFISAILMASFILICEAKAAGSLTGVTRLTNEGRESSSVTYSINFSNKGNFLLRSVYTPCHLVAECPKPELKRWSLNLKKISDQRPVDGPLVIGLGVKGYFLTISQSMANPNKRYVLTVPGLEGDNQATKEELYLDFNIE